MEGRTKARPHSAMHRETISLLSPSYRAMSKTTLKSPIPLHPTFSDYSADSGKMQAMQNKPLTYIKVAVSIDHFKSLQAGGRSALTLQTKLYPVAPGKLFDNCC